MLFRFLVTVIVFFAIINNIYSAEQGQVVIKDLYKINVEIVTSQSEQALGLGNRAGLQEGYGMLFLYDRASPKIFWMKGMRFGIDILWIYQGKVVWIEREVPPPVSLLVREKALKTYGHNVVANMVLEVPSKYSQKLGVQIGDTVELKR